MSVSPYLWKIFSTFQGYAHLFSDTTFGYTSKDVPKDPNFASKSTAHRWLQRWKKEGVFDQMLIHLLRQSQEEELTDCQRLMVDGSFSPCEDGR